MSRWRRNARVIIAVFAIAFAVYVAGGYKRRAPVPAPVVVRTDPGAVVESTGGRVERFKLSREDVRIEYEKQLTYADGTTKMLGVTIVTDDRAGVGPDDHGSGRGHPAFVPSGHIHGERNREQRDDHARAAPPAAHVSELLRSASVSST